MMDYLPPPVALGVCFALTFVFGFATGLVFRDNQNDRRGSCYNLDHRWMWHELFALKVERSQAISPTSPEPPPHDENPGREVRDGGWLKGR